MRRLKRAALAAMVLFFSVTMLQVTDVSAAKKKLTVNRVYNTTTKVKGKTKKKYTVKIKIGKKTYKAKANKKGKYTVKIPKQPAGKKLYVKAYKGKKLYKKKKVYVIAKTASIHKFSKTAKNIKGYTRPKYTVKVTVNGKTYKKKASKVKGYFNIKLGKAAGNATATVKVYNTKGKLFKTYKKKAYNASNNNINNSNNDSKKPEYTTADGKPYNGTMPELTDPIDVEGFDKKIESVKQFTDNGIYCDRDVTKNYDNCYSLNGFGRYGYVVYYLDDKHDNEYRYITAKNGITLYCNTGNSNNIQEIDTPTPENHEVKIASGQTGWFSPTYRNDRNIESVSLKIVGYKGGKPVIAYYETRIQLGYGNHLGEPPVVK